MELYDLAADPWEQHDLADEPALADVRAELVERLTRWQLDTADPLLDGPVPPAGEAAPGRPGGRPRRPG